MATPIHASSGIESKTLLNQAKELFNQGRFNESEAAFKKVVALSVDASQGFYGLGVIQLKRQDYAGAAVFFQNCVRLDPQNANAYYFLGETWEKQNLPDAAMAFFQKALAIDPTHRGAQQKIEASHRSAMSIRQSDSANGQVAHTPLVAGAGVYEYIRNDPSSLAKQTLSLIDSLQLRSVTPRLSAFAGSIALFAIAAFSLPLVGYSLLALYVYPVMFSPKARILPAAQNLVLSAKYAAIAMGLCFLVLALLVVLRAKTTKYTIDKGRLQVLKGIFKRKWDNIEFYRVEDIELHQTFFNRLTYDGALILHVAPGDGQKKTVELVGLARIDQLRELFEKLRSLVLLLRTGAWGKGVIH